VRASVVVLIATGIFVLGRWAHNKTAITISTVASAAFLVIVISALDNGRTEEIARGFAWLILAVAILSPDSPVTPVANLIAGKLSSKQRTV